MDPSVVSQMEQGMKEYMPQVTKTMAAVLVELLDRSDKMADVSCVGTTCGSPAIGMLTQCLVLNEKRRIFLRRWTSIRMALCHARNLKRSS